MIKKFTDRSDFASNMYLIKSEDGSFLIDPSFINKKVLSFIEKWGNVKAIIITHGHYDHFKAVDDYKSLFPNAPIYISRKEEAIFYNPHANCSILFGDNYKYDGKISLLDEGKYDIDEMEFEVMLMPGHTSGSMIIYYPKEKALFSGDFIFKGSIGRDDLPGGSYNDMKLSLKRFKELNLPSETIIFPGHGENTTYGAEIKNNPYLR